jgi:cytochrome c553
MNRTNKKKVQLGIVLLFLAVLVIWSPLLANSQNTSLQQSSLATDWRPNQAAGNAKFLGTDACAECHRAKVTTQKQTHMGKALDMATEAEILRSNPNLTYRQGPYAYQIVREGNNSTYSVTDSTNTISIPLVYCFGNGEAGQTYVLQYKDKFYESRVSFYDSLRGLDITMGHQPNVPKNLIEAMGREMKMEETRDCFGCHTTNGVSGKTLQLDHMMKGVTCEACHGPGEKHVAAMKAEDFKQNQIFNPKRLSTEELSNFCGTCHRSWEQVALMGLRGINNVRFQPYRLTNSKCYDSEDKRISCTACHDPHQERKRDAAFYDAKCAACHNANAKAAAAKLTSPSKRLAVLCKVGKAKCATCHMPKLEIPGSHFKFSDHQIRVVRASDEYPN